MFKDNLLRFFLFTHFSPMVSLVPTTNVFLQKMNLLVMMLYKNYDDSILELENIFFILTLYF